MNSKALKDIRKQLHNVVQELFPVIVQHELIKEFEKRLGRDIVEIKKQVAEGLKAMEEQQKATLEKIAQSINKVVEDKKQPPQSE